MPPRVARHIAMDLIKHAKSIEAVAYLWDKNGGVAAMEFAKQMDSRKLRKVNPAFTVSFNYLESQGPAIVKAEFLNGLKWETKTEGKTCADLRYEFYEMAGIVEEEAEEVEEVEKKPAPGGKKK